MNGVWYYGGWGREWSPEYAALEKPSCVCFTGQIKGISVYGSPAHIGVLLMYLSDIISFLSSFLENVILSTDFLRRFGCVHWSDVALTPRLVSL